MSSSLAWLDYSDAERQKVLDVVGLFREQDTRDELGLGVIRDGFADLLFPGTSTIQTRARYFLFLPWMYREIEERFAGNRDAAARSRRFEIKLIDVLAASDDSEGTIGVQARASLQRLPSNIYWQGLGRLGIRMMPWSQSQYHRWIDLGGPEQATAARDDDQDVEAESGFASWHRSMPAVPSGFPETVSLRLESTEAEYLTERLLSRAAGTLFAHLARSTHGWDRTDFVWEHPSASEFPAGLQEQVTYARAFSEAMHGAPLLYNLMLAELVDNPELIQAYRQAVEEWSALVEIRAAELSSHGPEGVWATIRPEVGEISVPTRGFVESWWELLESPAAVADSTRARDLVRARESAKKGGQARLTNAGARRMWGGESGTAQLNFRWRITQEHLLDIVTARMDTDA